MFDHGDLVLVKKNSSGVVMKKSSASVKRNCPSLLRLKKMRDWRGEPILPRWLYSPFIPSVKCKFWKLYIAVSVSMGMTSPNSGSMRNIFTSRGTPRSTTVLSRRTLRSPVKPCWSSVVMLPPMLICSPATWAWRAVQRPRARVMLAKSLLIRVWALFI